MLTRAGNLSLCFAFFLGCLLLAPSGAKAQPVEGCDQRVQEAQEAKSTVRTATDVNVTEEHIEKPDSTMATTCFNFLSGINASGAASGGGGIFSGDFISASPSGNAGGVRATIQDALQTFYTAYMDAMGADSGLVDYTQTALSNNPACTETADLWTQVKQGGVEQGVPMATITDLINGTMPGGANTDYTKNWGIESGTDNNFSNFATKLGAQPPAFQPAYLPTNGFCQDLITAGVTGACP
ncbi:MAG: hypothetical protein EPN97_07000 [Alphaproteobacteria bacterium]|nr:MAG: hypothetical protein EPN97_07000 [Alphaproteobacteria bacterium]